MMISRAETSATRRVVMSGSVHRQDSVANAQEVTFTTAGGLGESETAGLVMNVVPKTGGNPRHWLGCVRG